MLSSWGFETKIVDLQREELDENCRLVVILDPKKDFVAKLQIAQKEAAETLYWLELLNSSDYIPDKLYLSLTDECKEILAILAATIKSCAK